MRAKDLYKRLAIDFDISNRADDWSEMDVNEYITPEYATRNIGLMTDTTDTVDYVYTAVFPSEKVIEKILSDGRKNALLFLHHPMQWMMPETPVFRDIPKHFLKRLKDQKISLYNLHVPLDANGPFSTTVRMAQALGIEMMEEFDEYFGVKVGVIGKTNCQTLTQLKDVFEFAVGHPVRRYVYGDEIIQNQLVGLVAGGGHDASVYPYLAERGINTFLTGVASDVTGYQPTIEAHKLAKSLGINILAGTHYSTEKFACIAMLDYFKALGIPGEFLSDEPCLADM